MFFNVPLSEFISMEDLEAFCIRNYIDFDADDLNQLWYSYGRKLGQQNGCCPTASKSLGSVISFFFAKYQFTFDGTDIFFDEESIKLIADERIEEIAYHPSSVDDANAFLEWLVSLYVDTIDEFAYLTELKAVRLSVNDLELLQKVEGDSVSDKIRNIIRST